MKVAMKHPFTGETNILDLDITQEQLERHARGEHIQRVCPHLDADQREFLITGLLPGEYDELMKEEE